jgi:glutathione synthase/RimK-type ligase-like ATP-grasp enzyme
VKRIALVTSEAYPGLEPDSQLLLPALKQLGVDPVPSIWSDETIDWAAFDAVVVRSPWDYFDREAEFLAWLERANAAAKAFANPADLIAWNAHKTYLRELEAKGVPVVDTQWIGPGETATIEHERGIVKPAVAGGAKGLEQVSAGQQVTAEVDLLVQPLLESIRTEGELSLFYADGVFTHMVRKVPTQGDIRVQPEYGSVVTLEEPTAAMHEASDKVLQAIGRTLTYARVDLVYAGDGSLRLIELEIIEPQLYLAWAPAAATEAFAAAIAAVS